MALRAAAQIDRSSVTRHTGEMLGAPLRIREPKHFSVVANTRLHIGNPQYRLGVLKFRSVVCSCHHNLQNASLTILNVVGLLKLEAYAYSREDKLVRIPGTTKGTLAFWWEAVRSLTLIVSHLTEVQLNARNSY